MGKRIKALLMALVMLVTTVISVNFNAVKATADDGISVVFHFTNSTNTYDDYRMWIWTIGDGFEARMENNGTEATYTLNESSSTLKVGYIVKLGEGWEGKDYDGDRFIDLSQIISGTVDVYLTSGVADVSIDDSKATKGMKVVSASTEDLQVVTVQTSQAVDGDLMNFFGVKDTKTDEYVQVSSVVAGADNVYTIELASKLDAMGSYDLVYGFANVSTFMIGMPDFYSSEEFESQYTYTGDDLGATWTKDSTTFRVWAPLATAVKVNLYSTGEVQTDEFRNPQKYDVGDKIESVDMTKDVNGTWVATVNKDLNGVYYTYAATVDGKEVETIDPYARTAGTNGFKGMVIDLDSTDPEGWANDKNPCTTVNYEDDVIYELHIRDFSYDAGSGMVNKGKYLAFTETGTKNSFGQSTGVDYLKDLGVTHVHLLPTYDYSSVDEANLDKDQFNWGYDPQNYNLPEGSYSTDPSKGEVRVKEFKQMVQSLHNQGISVVMDVVYGHVSSANSFSVNVLTPSYYSRTNSNGSGCGNDTATERAMNRKFIVESMVYWAKEYHVDGFRIDQVGLFDTDTVNELTEALHAVDPTILLYGEGWSMSTNPSKKVKLATQSNADLTPGFGYFNDTIRDAVKGGVFDNLPGFVTRNFDKLGVLLDSLNGGAVWAVTPDQVINYNSCHDNYTLFDRITISNGDDTFEERVRENNMAAAILYTSQGVPFMQAGEEILRSKPLAQPDKNGIAFEGNSYASSSAMNAIKWDTLNDPAYAQVYEYYKGLIEFRKNHAGLRMTSYDDILDHFTYLKKGKDDDDCLVAYQIDGDANGEVSDGIIVILNASKNTKDLELPEGTWQICVNGEKAGTDVLGTATGKISIEPITAMVLVKGATKMGDSNGNGGNTDTLINTVITSKNDPSISVLGDPKLLDGTTLESSKLADNAVLTELKKLLDNAKVAFDDFVAYELTLKDAQGAEIHELNGKVYVEMNLMFDLAANDTVKVFRVDDDKLVECASTIKDGKIRFETDHFSKFIFVKQAAPAANESVKTGDSVAPIAVIAIILIACAGAVVLFSRKRKLD